MQEVSIMRIKSIKICSLLLWKSATIRKHTIITTYKGVTLLKYLLTWYIQTFLTWSSRRFLPYPTRITSKADRDTGVQGLHNWPLVHVQLDILWLRVNERTHLLHNITLLTIGSSQLKGSTHKKGTCSKHYMEVRTCYM